MRWGAVTHGHILTREQLTSIQANTVEGGQSVLDRLCPLLIPRLPSTSSVKGNTYPPRSLCAFKRMNPPKATLEKTFVCRTEIRSEQKQNWRSSGTFRLKKLG